jgi:acyl-CoA dehydrogenase family protein 9
VSQKTLEPEEKPSFLRSLFLGKVESDIILPFPVPPGEDRETVETVLDVFRRFAAENIDAAELDRAAHYPPELIRGLGDIGAFGLIVPEAYEGLGLTQTSYCRVMEEIAGVDASTAATLGAHLSIGMKAILLFGTESQKQEFLPRLASGEMVAAFALTEPEAGSDANAIRGTAELAEDGRHYIVNANKIWITNGGFADVFTVFARTGVETVRGRERNKLTAFLVTRDMTGVSTGEHEDKLGLRASSTTTVRLDDVKVPVENVLGDVDEGFKVAVEVLNEGRLGLAAGCIGGAKALMKEALQFAKTRKAFGRPIAEFEMIQSKFAWMAIHTYVMESMVYLTAAIADRKTEDFALESAACKVYCSERLWWIVNEALQINGGNGFMRELPYERALRDARINLIFEGTNEILRIFIALGGFQRSSKYLKSVAEALKVPLSSLGVLTDFAAKKLKRAVRPEGLDDTHPSLKRASDRFRTSVTYLVSSAEGAVHHHGKNIIDRQFIQSRIADMTMDIYAIAATISRTDALVRRLGSEGAATELTMCNRFVEKAWRRVRRNAHRVDFETDAPLADIARAVYERGGYRVP